MRLNSALLAVAVVALVGGVSCDVAALEKSDREIYDSFMMDGTLHRFDKRNGRVQKLSKHQTGAVQWIDVEVMEANGTTPPAPAPNPTSYIPPSVLTGNNPQVQQGNTASIGVGIRRGGAPVIEDDATAALPATEDITPEVRKDNLAVIASYENKVMPSHAIQIGERMKGNIFMKNSGDRRIKVLELTMYVHVKGLEKPEEYHIVFCNKSGHTPPPQPGSNGRDPAPLLHKVDMPAPSGEVKGPPDVKITYLQFE